MELLYRGGKYADEFLSDYIVRLSSKNGFSNVSAFKSAIKKHYSLLPSFGSYENPMGKNNRWLLEGVLRKNVRPDTIEAIRANIGGYWLNGHRTCLECYQTAPYVRFYWRLKRYRTCHVHDIKLVGMEHDELTVGNCKVIRKALISYEREDQIQWLVLLEIGFYMYELHLYHSLTKVLPNDKGTLDNLERLWRELIGGSLVGLSPQDRIEHFSNVLCRGDSDQEAMRRLIILVLTCSKETQDINHRGGSYKYAAILYKKFAELFICFDPVFKKINKQNGILSKNDVHEMCVSNVCMPLTDNRSLDENVWRLLDRSKNWFWV